MMYDNTMLAQYVHMVMERHTIWFARQKGDPPPWTADPVLTNLKMTNMFRVLDPGSQFVFQLDDKNPLDVIARLVFYRITNLPSTWYALRAAHGQYPTAKDFIKRSEMLTTFLSTYRDAGNQIFSGAYIIIPEPGTTNDKVEGAVRLTQRFLAEKAWPFLEATTQAERFAALRTTPGLGKFLSMQILTDWGYLQTEMPDLTFVVAGPGASRGAALLNPHLPAEAVIRESTIAWFGHPFVRLRGRPLTAMDVQNTMCEFSKYAREIVKPRKKTAYRPAHPGAQPLPILPQWW